MSYRICNTCNVLKPLDQEHFDFQKKRAYFVPQCKECRRSKSRARYANDPKFRERIKAQSSTPENRARLNERLKERRANDPEYRERVNAVQKERRATNPEFRERIKAQRSTPEYRARRNAQRRERYAIDSDYRECHNARQRERRANDSEYREQLNAKLRELRANDPVYRERQNKRLRDRWADNQVFRETQLAKQKEKYHNDPEFRESILDQQRSRRRNDPTVREKDRQRRENDSEYRQKKLSRQKHKYHYDQEFREKRRAYERRPEVRERNNAWNKNRWANNHAFRERQLARNKAKYQDPEYRQQHRDKARFRLYGLTRAEYDRKVEEQGGLCVICHKQPKTKLFVDHHHKSGQVRDLLCPNCNSGIGRFEENYGLLGKAAEYLAQAGLAPKEIPTITDNDLFATFEIPHWEAKSRDKEFRKEKNANLRQWYGINLSQYEWLLTKGNGVCWICLQPETLKRGRKALYPESLYVDHAHSSGMIRGLLCNNCNSGLGHLDDNSEILIAAIAYLRKWDWLNSVGEDY